MSAYKNPALLACVKQKLRISDDTDIMDDEVNGLIAAALCDMRMRGIDAEAACPVTATATGDMKPLAVMAVVIYCKANFGVSGETGERAQYWERYEGLTQSMSQSGEYRPAAGQEGGTPCPA